MEERGCQSTARSNYTRTPLGFKNRAIEVQRESIESRRGRPLYGYYVPLVREHELSFHCQREEDPERRRAPVVHRDER